MGYTSDVALVTSLPVFEHATNWNAVKSSLCPTFLVIRPDQIWAGTKQADPNRPVLGQSSSAVDSKNFRTESLGSVHSFGGPRRRTWPN